MQIKIDEKIYEVIQSYRNNRCDEYFLYHASKFLCTFYLDGRPMNLAVQAAINFLDRCDTIKNIYYKPKHSFKPRKRKRRPNEKKQNKKS